MRMKDVLLVQQNIVHVPMVTMARGKRKIVLIGVSHIASPDFYEWLCGTLDSYEDLGFQVLYEEIDTQFVTDSIDGQIFSVAIEERIQRIDALLSPFGLAYQSARFQPRASWISADFASVDWQQIFPNLGQMRRQALDVLDEIICDVKQKLIQPALDAWSDLDREVSIPPFMLKPRDELAVQTIRTYLKYSDIVLHYGAAHIPGIRRLLTRHGYKVVQTKWQPFFKLS